MTLGDRIRETSVALVAEEGLQALSFDRIAAHLGCSKQAVLYWYPSKKALISGLYLPWLQAECDAGVAALEGITLASEAIRAFVGAVARFHLGDLERFRLMYLAVQTVRGGGPPFSAEEIAANVHPVTDRLYAALAAKLSGDPAAARRRAFAIHSATLGLVLMYAMAEAVGDPLKHTPDEMIETLAATLRAW